MRMDWETRERPGRCADASRGRRQGSEACRGSWATVGGDEAKVGGERNSADTRRRLSQDPWQVGQLVSTHM